jgi:hypothetical protein
VSPPLLLYQTTHYHRLPGVEAQAHAVILIRDHADFVGIVVPLQTLPWAIVFGCKVRCGNRQSGTVVFELIAGK